MRSGFRNSSSKISPGGIAGPSQFGSLVIVFDPDFVGMSLLPPKRHAIPVVHSKTVTAGLVPLQWFQPVARGNGEVFEPGSDVECFELPLDDPPDCAGNSPGGASVPFSEQVCGGLVAKRLDHGRDYILHG
jgi:hypothetical protein